MYSVRQTTLGPTPAGLPRLVQTSVLLPPVPPAHPSLCSFTTTTAEVAFY